jgi:hypothetical protein
MFPSWFDAVHKYLSLQAKPQSSGLFGLMILDVKLGYANLLALLIITDRQ